jgi:hypothetical protein
LRTINEQTLRQKLNAILHPITVTYFFRGVSRVTVNPLQLVSGSQGSVFPPQVGALQPA